MIFHVLTVMTIAHPMIFHTSIMHQAPAQKVKA